MNKRDLFEMIYNNMITENDVIVKIDKTGEEYNSYIVNDGFDYWYDKGDGIISLSFFKNNGDYEFKIISKQEYIIMMKEKERNQRIEELKRELALLEN